MTATPYQARVVAVFVCGLRASQHPGREEVRRAVAAVLRRHSARWCMAQMAQQFQADPELSACRLTWALRVVRDCYGRSDPVPPTRCRATGRSADEFYAGADSWSGRRTAPRCPFTVGRYRRAVS